MPEQLHRVIRTKRGKIYGKKGSKWYVLDENENIVSSGYDSITYLFWGIYQGLNDGQLKWFTV